MDALHHYCQEEWLSPVAFGYSLFPGVSPERRLYFEMDLVMSGKTLLT